MPRRPLHPGPAASWWARILEMLKDIRTWTTLAYLLVMLPLGIIYFTVAVTGLAISASFIGTPLLLLGQHLGWVHWDFMTDVTLFNGVGSAWSMQHPLFSAALLFLAGLIILTLLMHLARALIRGHARLAKSLLVVPGA
jgi:hypothetical protein